MKRCIIFFFLILSIISCKDDEGIDDGDTEIPVKQGQVSGKIQLPEGFTIDTTGSKVVSVKSDSRVDKSTYVVDTVGKFSTTFLTNGVGEIIMMRYNYPGQESNDISVESTAIALFMASPIMLTLTPAARIEVIKQISSVSDYDSFVKEISKSLVEGKSVTDTTNFDLAKSLGKLFETASNLRIQLDRDLDKPILVETEQPGTISFENNKVAHQYAVGVYRRGQTTPVGSYMIKGTQMAAASWADAVAGYFGKGYNTPDLKIFTSTSNGFYDIKIRSGRGDEDGEEFKRARMANVIAYALKLALEKIPIMDEKCYKAVEQSMMSTIKKQEAFIKAKSPSEYEGTMLDVAISALENGEKLIKECSTKEVLSMGLARNLLSVVSLAWKVGGYINIGYHVHDLFMAKPAIDTCFRFYNQKIVSCKWYKMVYPGPGDLGKDVSTKDIIPFFDGEKEIFDLVFDDKGSKNYGLQDTELDYSQIKVENISNVAVTVELKHENPYFSIILSTAIPEGAETKFDITYKGVPVQTVNAEVLSNVKDYILEISTYRPDYSLVKPVFTLKPNDEVTLPNRLREVVRLKYKGEYVKVGLYSLDATNHYFKLDQYPVDADDHYVGKYFVTINDRTNGREVRFPIDLTLSNKIYRAIIGRKIKHTRGTTERTLVLKADMTYDITYSTGEKGGSGTFTLNHDGVHAHNYVEQCGIDKRIVGYAYFGRLPPTFFEYILLYEDGTLSGGGFYGCPGYEHYGKLE